VLRLRQGNIAYTLLPAVIYYSYKVTHNLLLILDRCTEENQTRKGGRWRAKHCHKRDLSLKGAQAPEYRRVSSPLSLVTEHNVGSRK